MVLVMESFFVGIGVYKLEEEELFDDDVDVYYGYCDIENELEFVKFFKFVIDVYYGI